MNRSLKYLSVCLLIFQGHLCFSQADSIWKPKPNVDFSGFIDVFYAYDFNRPDGARQPFLYNHNQHNEFNLNLGLIKAAVVHQKYRANFALQAGTYGNQNYAAETGLLKNIFEANVGLSLNQKDKLWLDAGIFGSHIGFEGAISIDNWTLTRSLLAENSPYYLSGVKLTYNPTIKWELVALVCNGWQRISRVPGNSLPSFGTQLKWAPAEKVTLNWSTFIGTDEPDSTRLLRYFNNFYGQLELREKVGVIVGFDIGLQQTAKNSQYYENWLSPVIIAKYKIEENWAIAIRVEYYNDVTGIIIQSPANAGFKTWGYSINLDYSPTKNIACRLEGRLMNSPDRIFPKASSHVNNNMFIVSSIAARFNNR